MPAMNANPSVFISYRRSDAAGYAFVVWDRLRQAFGEAAVFFDRDGKHHLPSGSDWEKLIFAALDDARACVVAIGPDWLAAGDGNGLRRIDQPEDIVRREVAHALERADQGTLTLFPALFGNGGLPERDALPANLRGLHRWQARTYDLGRHADTDFESLIDEIAACPGVRRVLTTREHREAFAMVKSFIAEGHLTPEQGEALKMQIAKELALAAAGAREP